jgi:hypothetical protein
VSSCGAVQKYDIITQFGWWNHIRLEVEAFNAEAASNWTLAGAEFLDEEEANSPFFAFLVRDSITSTSPFLSSEEFEGEDFAGGFAMEPVDDDAFAWTTFFKSSDSLEEERGGVCFGGRFGRECDDDTWPVFVEEGVGGFTVLELSELVAEVISSSPVMRFHLLTPDWHWEGSGGAIEIGGGGEGEP